MNGYLPLINGAGVQDQGEVFEFSFPSACTTLVSIVTAIIYHFLKKNKYKYSGPTVIGN